jgi:glyceraldehyde-3-phosphate dehydrogenase/erythrose-4-phosphate dehydrogenase
VTFKVGINGLGRMGRLSLRAAWDYEEFEFVQLNDPAGDALHKDQRRARACGMSMIPTTSGSATAITHIFPELAGKLNGHAVRVPLANASLTDCVFEVHRETSVKEVNALLRMVGELEAA